MNRSDRYNSEGYPDPTAYAALKMIEDEELRLLRDLRQRYPYPPFVYICSPYSGDVERNTEKAKRYARFAIAQGAYPFVPHLLYPQFMNDSDPKERKLALNMGLAFLCKCKELWVFGGFLSAGMSLEVDKALSMKDRIVIRRFNTECEEVL